MGLVCGTPTRFMPAADTAAARTAQATTITPAPKAGVKNPYQQTNQHGMTIETIVLQIKKLHANQISLYEDFVNKAAS